MRVASYAALFVVKIIEVASYKTSGALVKTRTGPDRTGPDRKSVNKNVNHLPRALRSFGSGRYLE